MAVSDLACHRSGVTHVECWICKVAPVDWFRDVCNIIRSLILALAIALNILNGSMWVHVSCLGRKINF